MPKACFAGNNILGFKFSEILKKPFSKGFLSGGLGQSPSFSDFLERNCYEFFRKNHPNIGI